MKLFYCYDKEGVIHYKMGYWFLQHDGSLVRFDQQNWAGGFHSFKPDIGISLLLEIN